MKAKDEPNSPAKCWRLLKRKRLGQIPIKQRLAGLRHLVFLLLKDTRIKEQDIDNCVTYAAYKKDIDDIQNKKLQKLK